MTGIDKEEYNKAVQEHEYHIKRLHDLIGDDDIASSLLNILDKSITDVLNFESKEHDCNNPNYALAVNEIKIIAKRLEEASIEYNEEMKKYLAGDNEFVKEFFEAELEPCPIPTSYKQSSDAPKELSIDQLKKKIKYSKNPFEKRQLNDELNYIYKKNKHRRKEK